MGYDVITDISRRIEDAVIKDDDDIIKKGINELYEVEKKIKAGLN